VSLAAGSCAIDDGAKRIVMDKRKRAGTRREGDMVPPQGECEAFISAGKWLSREIYKKVMAGRVSDVR
jgi:hypothetical protein